MKRARVCVAERARIQDKARVVSAHRHRSLLLPPLARAARQQHPPNELAPRTPAPLDVPTRHAISVRCALARGDPAASDAEIGRSLIDR